MPTKHSYFVILLLIILIFTILPTSFAQDNTQAGLPEGAIARLGKGGIGIMRFSPDGTRLAVGTSIGIWLYDIPNGQETSLFTGQYEEISALAFSTDGKLLASGSLTNHVIQLWDLNSGNKLPILTLHDRFAEVSALEFSPGNNRLFSLSKFGFITEWDINAGKEISAKNFSDTRSVVAFAPDGKTFVTGEPEKVVAFAPDGKTFVTGEPEKNEIRLWDEASGSLGDVFKEKPDPSLGRTIAKLLGGDSKEKKVPKGVETLAYSSDSKTIASAHDDNIVRLWDTATKVQRVNLKGHSEIINTITFSPDSTLLASGSADNTIMLWDVNKGRHVVTLSGHKNSINALTFSPTKKGLLASGSSDGTVRFWDTNTGDELAIFATGYTESVKSVAFSKNNAMLCSAASNGTVQIWNTKTGKELPSPPIPHYDMINALAFSQDATLFACNGADTIVSSKGTTASARWRSHKEIQLWMLPTGDQLTSYSQETSTLAFSPDNKILAAGTRHQGIRLLDINSGVELFNFNTKDPFERNLVFSPNGKFLATYGTHIQTQLWDVTEQREIMLPNIQNTNALAFSPNSSLLALKYREGIDLWRITPIGIEKHKVISLENHRGFGSILLFSPDGNTLLDIQSVGRKHLIQLWDVDSGRDHGTVSGHTKWIETLAFSHDGKILASGAADGTVLLWDWDKIISKAKEKIGN